MATKKQSVQDVLNELRTKKHISVGSVEDIHEPNEHVVGWSTGNLALDYVTGVGGLPKGRVTELFGPPSSGKTTALLQTMVGVQKYCMEHGGYIMFNDFEFALDLEYAASLGLEPDHPSFILGEPETFEQGADAYRALLKTGELRMAGFDSVAAMVTEKEIEADTGASTPMDRAKMMHQFMRQVKAAVRKYDSSLVFLNHTMEKVDMTPMGQKNAARGIKKETQPGGTALPFYASLRIAFKQVGNVRSRELNVLTNEKEDLILSTNVEARAIKNKVGDPFRMAQLRVRFGRGFSEEYSVLRITNAYGAVKRDGAGQYYFPADAEWLTEPLLKKVKKGEAALKVRGEDTVLKLMEASPEWSALLQKRAVELLDVHTMAYEDEDGQEMAVDTETGEVL